MTWQAFNWSCDPTAIPAGFAQGSDHSIWALDNYSFVQVVDPSVVAGSCYGPLVVANLNHIDGPGNDGNVWATLGFADLVSIDLAGTSVDVTTPPVNFDQFVCGPDGRLWQGHAGSPNVYVYDPTSNSFATYSVGTGNGNFFTDGIYMYFQDSVSGLYRVTTAGVATLIGTAPVGVTFSCFDGTWFWGVGGGLIANMDMTGATATFTYSALPNSPFFFDVKFDGTLCWLADFTLGNGPWSFTPGAVPSAITYAIDAPTPFAFKRCGTTLKIINGGVWFGLGVSYTLQTDTFYTNALPYVPPVTEQQVMVV